MFPIILRTKLRCSFFLDAVRIRIEVYRTKKVRTKLSFSLV